MSENPTEPRMLGVRLAPAMWQALSAEAHRRSLAAGRTIGTGQVVRDALTTALGLPVGETVPRGRKTITHRVTSAKPVRNRNRATGCNPNLKAGG